MFRLNNKECLNDNCDGGMMSEMKEILDLD